MNCLFVLIFSFSFFLLSFILFVAFFCLQLFLSGFVICCNRNLLYLLDEVSSGDWSLAQGDYTGQRAIPEKIQTGDKGVNDIDFPGILKKEHVEIPEVN